jgi:hypothetical protein
VAWLEEGTSLLHMIPHRAGLSRDPLYSTPASYVWHIQAQLYILSGQVRLARPQPCLSGTVTENYLSAVLVNAKGLYVTEV